MSYLTLLNLLNSKRKFTIKKTQNKENYRVNSEVKEITQAIEENGYYIIENYIDKDNCTLLRNEIDTLIEKFQNTKILILDDENSDHRIFGSEKISTSIRNLFYEDSFLLDIAQNYFKGKMWLSNTLAARLDFKENNLGSGGGWHRDAHNFQFKAILYLSDVTIENGPFQIIEGSHHFTQCLKDTLTMKVNDMTTRYSNSQIEKIIQKNPKKHKILTAKAGTLILADTSSLHTGMPIAKGNRYTLFNYFYPSYQNKMDIINKFDLDNSNLSNYS